MWRVRGTSIGARFVAYAQQERRYSRSGTGAGTSRGGQGRRGGPPGRPSRGGGRGGGGGRHWERREGNDNSSREPGYILERSGVDDDWSSTSREDLVSDDDYFGEFGCEGEYTYGTDENRSYSIRGGDGGGAPSSRLNYYRPGSGRRGGSRGSGGHWQGGGRGDGYARKEKTGPSMKDLWIGDVVYGVSPVLAALESGRREIHTLYVQEGADSTKRKDKSALLTATARARELKAKVVVASKHDLNMVSDNRPHQGLVLDASPLDFETLETMPDAASVWDGEQGDAAVSRTPPPIWLCLDEVMDPQNFGAALRSAFFLGAAGVLTCRRNSAPLSGTVSKASAGAMEIMPVHACRSLPQTLEDAKQRDWAVIGAAADGSAVSASSFIPDRPTILIMGNEGHGLRTTVRRLCDVTLRIDGAPTAGANALGLGDLGGERARQGRRRSVDSLNVSVATGILLHQLLARVPPLSST